MSKLVPQVYPTQIVEVARTPSGPWLPAIVQKASSGGTNSNVACTAFDGRLRVYFEACKHSDDPFWDRSDAQEVAVAEHIGLWRLPDYPSPHMRPCDPSPGVAQAAQPGQADKPAKPHAKASPETVGAKA